MSTFHLHIVTPDGEFYNGEAQSLTVRTLGGDATILPRHIRYVTALGFGEARLTIDGVTRHASCIGGMLTVSENKVRLVATTFEWASDIDIARATEAKEHAEKLIECAKSREDLETAKLRLKRATVRLKVATANKQ